ncbi:MAG: hypothetical protein J2P45_28290, partial [Candidatus Dormibacteraeota bacterium]|nr:hypothetical protein [Candidatus Dormibacteraeota bacterium]
MRPTTSALGRLSPRSRALLGATLVLVLAAGGAIAFLAIRGQGPAGVAPRVVALATSSGAAVSEGDLIPAATPLQLTFNTTMDEPSVRLLANGAPIPLSWRGDGTSAALDVGTLHVGPVALAVASGARDASGSELPDWKLAFRMVFGLSAHTVPLGAPALVQVPNDPAARDQLGLQSAAIV